MNFLSISQFAKAVKSKCERLDSLTALFFFLSKDCKSKIKVSKSVVRAVASALGL